MSPSCAPWPSLAQLETAAASRHVPVHGYSCLAEVGTLLMLTCMATDMEAFAGLNQMWLHRSGLHLTGMLRC